MHGKKEERYERILAESSRLFAEKGYEQTTISDVVKACDMARGTFYLYFESLEQVLSTLFSNVMGLIWEEVQRIIQQQGNETDFKKIVSGIFQLLSARKELLTVFHCGGGRDFYEFKYTTIRDTLGTGVAELIEKGQDNGNVRSLSPDLVAMMITSLIDQMAYYHTILTSDSHTQEQVIEELVNFILFGIRKQNF